MIRLLLVEDHASFRQAIALCFAQEPEFAVAAQAGSLAEARAKLHGVDVAIVDMDLPDGRGLSLIKEIRAANPGCRVLVLTGSASRNELLEAVELGAAGWLHKTAALEEITEAARRLGRGEQLLSHAQLIEILREAGQQREQGREVQAAFAELTKRERAVLEALGLGLNDRDIATHLHITVETARNHMASILRKLGVESRLQALLLAIRHGVVRVE